MNTTRRLLVLAAATLASALPAGVALADDPPVVTAPPYVVTVPPDYCNVVIVVDGPVGPDGSQAPGTTIFTPCGTNPVIPVLDGPADVGPVNAEPAPAARLGYVPAWAMIALGL